jgi:hypothetical protein
MAKLLQAKIPPVQVILRKAGAAGSKRAKRARKAKRTFCPFALLAFFASRLHCLRVAPSKRLTIELSQQGMAAAVDDFFEHLPELFADLLFVVFHNQPIV